MDVLRKRSLVGYLPANIRLRIEKSFEEGDLRTIFCTSTLVEGVNLPADNLFMTSYKTGLSNMDEVEFRNLVGRVGRIKYNLYGNVFFVRDDTNLLDSKYISLLKEDVPSQKLSIERLMIIIAVFIMKIQIIFLNAIRQKRCCNL